MVVEVERVGITWLDESIHKAELITYIYINQKDKIMNNKLLVFRIACVIFIITNFICSYKMENEAEVLIMVFNFLFTLSLIIAEVNNAFDKAEHK
jgi:hypothetical protein